MEEETRKKTTSNYMPQLSNGPKNKEMKEDEEASNPHSDIATGDPLTPERNEETVLEASRLSSGEVAVSGPLEACPRSRRSVVREILNELTDLTCIPACSSRQSRCYNLPTCSQFETSIFSQSEMTVAPPKEYVVYSGRVINSATVLHAEAFLQKSSLEVTAPAILPTYSAVMKMGPTRRSNIDSFSSISFLPKQAPPSYAEVEGAWDDVATLVSSESYVFGPHPVYIVCPRCRTIVVSSTEQQRSHVAYITSLVLCLCLCWPCCLLPFCLKACNYTLHSCPNCHHYFGRYSPCGESRLLC